MAIPSGYDSLYGWYNQTVSDMSANNLDIFVLQKFWGQLTQQQKDALKTSFQNKIDASISELQDIKTHISGL